MRKEKSKAIVLRQKGTFAKRLASGVLACFLLTGTALSGCFTAFAEENNRTLPSGTSYTEIGSEIESFVSENEDTTAALSVSVFDSEKVIYENYFGFTDLENQVTADENSVIEWGSVTKTLIWVSVMQLWEQGKIDLEADIQTYLPDDYLKNLNYDEPITMTNLMNHNAGFQEVLSDLFLEEYDGYDGSDLESVLSKNQPEQIYKPGTVTAYSNWSSALAAYIVERISGQTFGEYVHANIFDKLNMDKTAILPDLSDNEWVKSQRDTLTCYTPACVSMGNTFYSIELYPAGMCTSTLEDFRTYAQALIAKQAGILFENESTYEELYSPTSYHGDTDIIKNFHGFWAIQYGVPTLGHGGNTAGCSSYLLLDLESEVGMVIMTNQVSEMVYNTELPELVFGKYSDSQYYGNKTENTSGVFKLARTVEEGPLSFYKAMSYLVITDEASEFYPYYDELDGIAKISEPYGDYLKVYPSEYIPVLILIVLMVFAAVYSVITLLIGGCIVTPVKKRIQKSKGIEKAKSPLNKWNYIACGIISLWVVNLATLASQIISNAPSSHYIRQIALMGVFGIAMLAVTALLAKKLHENKASALSVKVKCWFTVIALMGSVINILYFEMYQFWAL